MKTFPNQYRLLEAVNAVAMNFSWVANGKEILITGLLSMVPCFEGRYAVTMMVGMGMPVGFAYALSVLCSTLPMPFILLLLRPVLDWFYTLPIGIVRKFAAWLTRRSEKKRQKMLEKQDKGLRGKLKGKVSGETIELIGLCIFVAIPLPGTGVWTGSAIASLFNMPRLKSALAILLGNIIACGVMTLAACGVITLF